MSATEGDPALQADLIYSWANGLTAGMWATSTKQSAPSGERRALEMNAYLGYDFNPAASWSARIGLVHYAYPWSKPARGSYDELFLSATWLGRLSLSVAAAPNRPNAVGTVREAAYDYEVALRAPLIAPLSFDVGIGYYDMRRVTGMDYAYGSAGVGYSRQRLSLSLSWIGTDSDGRALYGELAENRVVANVLWSF